MVVTLKAARINAGFTQREAANMLGIAVDTLGNYERGKTSPDVATMKKIESVYNVSFDNIVFDES